jgi:threonine dehydrogenase-like Zn-dependent dehydrogenase
MVTHAFRTAVVGAGYMGALHARVLAEAKFAELVLVVDPSPAAAQLAEQYGVEHMPSIDGLIGRSDVEAVVVAAPDRLHGEIAIALLDDGKSVMLEKPIAHDGQAAQAVLDAAARSSARCSSVTRPASTRATWTSRRRSRTASSGAASTSLPGGSRTRRSGDASARRRTPRCTWGSTTSTRSSGSRRTGSRACTPCGPTPG